MPDLPDLPEEFEELLRRFGMTPGSDGRFDLSQLITSLQSMMGRAGMGDGKISWSVIKDTARQVSHRLGADPFPDTTQKSKLDEACSLADMWLDSVPAFERLNQPNSAWTRAEWIEGTIGVWEELVSPVADNLSRATASLMDELVTEDPMMGSMLRPMLQSMASTMLSAQIGQAMGELPSHSLTATDIGLPLLNPPRVALLPQNISEYAMELDFPVNDLQIYLAVRETARQRLFAAVPWLGPQMLALVTHYASKITIDHDQIRQQMEEQMSQLTGASLDMAAMTQASQDLAGTLFTPVVTDEQRGILERLEALSALVEGWVDHVVTEAIKVWMPNPSSLHELVRRHKASSGKARSALTQMIGLDLRPRRIRDAANLWAAVNEFQGPEAALAKWAHPDLMPTNDDLDDPVGYAQGTQQPAAPDDFDEQLAKWLEGDD